MRLKGDPAADQAIVALLATGEEGVVEKILATLTRNDELVPDDLPPAVRAYFASLPDIPEPEQEIVDEGQDLFADFGPEIILILACYSLPDCYAAGKGVQVLYRTGFLAERPNRRLFQTAQMVVDVLTPGGLGPSGRGRRTAQKVRLMHAAIRHLVLTDPKTPWAPELGVPINQEDLAGTLMSFTSLILDGLGKLGTEVAAARAASYLAAWQVVAQHMGIVPELIPASVQEANELTAIIRRRQDAVTPEGQAMTAALEQMLAGFMPPGLKHMPCAAMRMFLGDAIADGLGVPVARFDEALLHAGISIGTVLDKLTGGEARRRIFRHFGLAMIQLFLDVELGGRRPPFQIPTELRDGWEGAQV